MKNYSADFETIQCPLCSETDFSVVYPGKFPENLSREFLTNVYRSSSDQMLFEQVVRCTRCGLVYLNPRLKSNFIVDSYAEGEDRTFIEQDAFRIRTFTSALRRLSREHGLALSSETRALDIGCAGGAFLRAACDLGISAIGIEPSKWLGDYARSTHGLDVRSGTLSDSSFPNVYFDLVTLWDVIEHVPDPKVDLREIHRILKPEGLLVVNYPDFGSLAARILGKKWPFLLSVHLVYYTRRTLRHQLSKAGFKVVRMRPHWQVLELRYILKRMAAYIPLVRFLGMTVEKFGVGSIPILYWMGQTQVVAQRCR